MIVPIDPDDRQPSEPDDDGSQKSTGSRTLRGCLWAVAVVLILFTACLAIFSVAGSI